MDRGPPAPVRSSALVVRPTLHHLAARQSGSPLPPSAHPEAAGRSFRSDTADAAEAKIPPPSVFSAKLEFSPKRWTVADRMQKIEQILVRQQEQIDALCQQATGPSQRQEDPAFDTTDPFQRKSSVASTELRSDDALMTRNPVDDITERNNCELHMSMKNISMKVAVGFALPSGRRATYHCSPIPDGYAVVGVDEVLKGFENLELDFPAGEDETELGEVRKTIILWKKQNIVFPHLAPRPPTPQSSNPALSLPPQPSPARLPTPLTKPRVEKRKSSSTALSTSTTAKKSAGTRKKAKEAPAKLPYEMTDEETKRLREEISRYKYKAQVCQLGGQASDDEVVASSSTARPNFKFPTKGYEEYFDNDSSDEDGGEATEGASH